MTTASTSPLFLALMNRRIEIKGHKKMEEKEEEEEEEENRIDLHRW